MLSLKPSPCVGLHSYTEHGRNLLYIAQGILQAYWAQINSWQVVIMENLRLLSEARPFFASKQTIHLGLKVMVLKITIHVYMDVYTCS